MSGSRTMAHVFAVIDTYVALGLLFAIILLFFSRREYWTKMELENWLGMWPVVLLMVLWKTMVAAGTRRRARRIRGRRS